MSDDPEILFRVSDPVLTFVAGDANSAQEIIRRFWVFIESADAEVKQRLAGFVDDGAFDGVHCLFRHADGAEILLVGAPGFYTLIYILFWIGVLLFEKLVINMLILSGAATGS